MTRNCKCGCGSSIAHKHPNARFINQKHKDEYHNWTNPRGKFAHLAEYSGSNLVRNIDNHLAQDPENYDPGDSEYWDSKD